MATISVKHLTKTFKVSKRNSGLKAAIKSFFKREYIYIDAVKDVSFEINKGEIVGYIGPNGAGKSTTIKMLSGILLPTSGEIKVLNYNPSKDRKKYVSNIGVVFGQRSQLAWDIPAEDTFDLIKDIYKLDEDEYLKTKHELTKLLKIEDIIKKPVRNISLGERMRCEIVASLLHKPKILLLYEPTIGLDTGSKKIVREFILKINKEHNITVILTSHDMEDIEKLAKRIILIGKGQLLYDGSLSNLKKKYGNNKNIYIKTKEKITDLNIKGIIKFEERHEDYKITIDSNIIELSEFIDLFSKQYTILEIDVDNEKIDDIILNLYEDYKI